MSHSKSAFIELHNLSRSFGEGERRHCVLQNISLKIERGEIVALLGRSGGGKSTLLNLISGIDVPDSGSITVDGLELNSLNEHDRTLFRREHIGFIYQFFNLVPTLTARENIEFILELNGVAKPEMNIKVQDLMRELELLDSAHLFPSQLSGGEQQRVAIARALIHCPKIILADEPSGNLDAKTGELMLNVLRTMLAKNNSSMLLVTHSLGVANMADRIVTLEDGVLAERVGDFAW